MIGPPTFIDPLTKKLRPELQFATVLAIQNHAVPEWYLHISVVHQLSDDGGGWILPVRQWPQTWQDVKGRWQDMNEYIQAACEMLIPDIEKRKFWRDVYEKCVVYRAPLNDQERAMMAPEDAIAYWQ